MDFKTPKIKTGSKWFIEYWYRVPDDLRKMFPKEWWRFKVYEDINRTKTVEYAKQLRDDVELALRRGYNPFEQHSRILKDATAITDDETKIWNAQQALLYFLQKWNGRGLDKNTVAKYERVVKLFIAWLQVRDLNMVNIKVISSSHIEKFLEDNKKLHDWSNRHYNNTRDFLRTAFIFLQKKKIITHNPCQDIDKLRSVTRKHKYYDKQTFERLKIILEHEDPYLFFASQVIYYLCVRSEKELKNLKVGNIVPERKQVLIEQGKGGRDRFIPLSEEMLRIFQQRKIFDYPKDFYIFSVSSKTRFVKDGSPGTTPFGNGFFSKRFAAIRKKAKLSSDHTLYSFKHTRVIHLKLDGASDAEIMSLTGHSEYDSFAKYLRDIGVDVNVSRINELSRKF